VDVFFVLSGYLITRLLLREQIATGRLDRRAFYRRRVRRLLPALAVLLAVWLGVTLTGLLPVERLGTSAPHASVGLALVPVVGAFTLLFNWMLALDIPTPTGMGHLWTLSVEEQFYLVWPTVIFAVATERKHPERALWRLVLAGIAFSLLITVIAALRGQRDFLYFSSPTSGLGLLVGAAVAIRPPKGWGSRLGAVGLATILGCALLVPDDRPALLPWAVIATCFATGAVISSGAPRLDRALAVPWLRYAGRRSYAIYLWSSPLAYATALWGGRTWQMAALLVAASFGLAELSWRLVERRFVARRPAPQPAPKVALALPATETA
jgi:peptidoglycan/LPS O-acetylase OafA/YrhL